MTTTTQFNLETRVNLWGLDDILYNKLYRQIHEGKYCATRSYSWQVDPDSTTIFDPTRYTISKQTGMNDEGIYTECTGVVIDPEHSPDPSATYETYSYVLIYDSETIFLNIISDDHNSPVFERLYDEYRELYKPVGKVTVDTDIWFLFWTKNGGGEPTYNRRKIAVPKWDDIKYNYSTGTYEQLEKLSETEFDENASGKLILWHGEPGTGKTTALRAIAHKWQKWCNFNYFAYPEDFFYSSNYMLQTILMETNNSNNYYDEAPLVSGNGKGTKKGEKWNLYIFEDAGEFLTKDAKETQGQGLSRLLNLVDGIIGQGLKILVLITTNEPIGSMHEAIVRPGRTSSIIEFTALDYDESRSWAEYNARDLPEPEIVGPNKKATIAQLYNGSVPSNKTEKRKVGF